MFLKQEVHVKYSLHQQHVICMCTGSGNSRTGSTHCPLASVVECMRMCSKAIAPLTLFRYSLNLMVQSNHSRIEIYEIG